MMIKKKMNNYISKIKQATERFLKDPFFLSRWETTRYSRTQDDNQLSIRIGYLRAKSFHYRGDGHMFIQDIYTDIMPYAHMVGEREKYPSTTSPSSREKEELIANGISGSSYRELLTDALFNFVRNTSHTLSQQGIVLYEVVYAKDDAGSVTSFSFENIDSAYLFRFLGGYYQIIPWWVAKKSNVRVQIIRIPSEKILRIDFPKQLGGKRKMQKMLKRLWKLSKETIPEFQMDALKENKQIGFNLQDYVKNRYLETAKLTAIFGWNQRQTSVNYITEYYWFLRYLQKVRAQIIIREEILSRLNGFLNGPVLNLKTNVSIKNLPTMAIVDEQEELMKRGDIKFVDIYTKTKI